MTIPLQLPLTGGTQTVLRPTHKVKGLVCRAETYDAFVAREIEPTYGWMTVRDRVVLDIGANIGGYTRWALDHGAASVVAIEPGPCNFACLQVNAADPDGRANLHHAAVGRYAGVVDIWVSPAGKNPANTSTVPFRGRLSAATVPRLAFDDLLDAVRPAVLKIDVEGAEYDFLHGPLPEYVQEVTMELHFTRADWRATEAPRLISYFAGWECVRAPVCTGSRWFTVGAWRR